MEGTRLCLSRMPDLGRRLSPIYMDVADRPPLTRPRGRGKRIAFGSYGGKFNHLAWLLPLLPEAQHYRQPFAGSAAVLLNRAPSPVETYNDTDGAVVNFFRVLRDDWPELQRLIALTLFSREEFHLAITDGGGVRRLSARGGFMFVRGRLDGPGAECDAGAMGELQEHQPVGYVGRGVALAWWRGRVERYRRALDAREDENRPALDVIRLYDSADTLFYCDPPYVHATRGDTAAYGFEMSDEDHEALAAALHQCRGKVAISGYRNDFMDRLYQGWRRFDAAPKQAHSIKAVRFECLWMNY